MVLPLRGRGEDGAEAVARLELVVPVGSSRERSVMGRIPRLCQENALARSAPASRLGTCSQSGQGERSFGSALGRGACRRRDTSRLRKAQPVVSQASSLGRHDSLLEYSANLAKPGRLEVLKKNFFQQSQRT